MSAELCGARLFWEANSFPSSQEIPDILCNQKISYCVYTSLPLVAILSHVNSPV